MRQLTNLFMIVLLIIGSACSSKDRRKNEYRKITMGMSKSEVLDTAGTPDWSDRRQGHDRWIYYLNPIRKEQERLVYFKDGVVVYKGDRIKPQLSAEEMDAIKKPRIQTKPFKRSYSKKQLRRLIKKSIQEDKAKKKEKNPKNLKPL